jgi:hypothetical protein
MTHVWKFSALALLHGGHDHADDLPDPAFADDDVAVLACNDYPQPLPSPEPITIREYPHGRKYLCDGMNGQIHVMASGISIER